MKQFYSAVYKIPDQASIIAAHSATKAIVKTAGYTYDLDVGLTSDGALDLRLGRRNRLLAMEATAPLVTLD